MLVRVQTIETFLNFLIEIVRDTNLRCGNVLQRLRDYDVRQEARHRLLGAAVRITRQVIERPEQSARDRRRRLYAQITRGHIGSSGQIEVERLFGIVLSYRDR